MPRVPTAGTTQGGINYTPQSQPLAEVGMANRIADETFGKAAQLAFEFEARDREAKRKQLLVDGEAEVVGKLLELQQQAQDDPNFDGATARFEEQASEAVKDITSRYDRDTAAALQVRGTQLATSIRVSVKKDERDKFNVNARETFNTLTENYAQAVAEAPNALVAEQLTAAFRDAVSQSDLLSVSDKKTLYEGFNAKVAETVAVAGIETITGLIDQADVSEDETEALELLGVAEELLKDPKDTPWLDHESRMKARGVVAQYKDKTVARFNAGKVRSLVAFIDAAETEEDAKIATQDTNALFDKGVISETKAIELDRNLRARMAKVAVSDTGAELIALSMKHGIPIDPKDIKAVDSFVEMHFLPALDGMTDEEQRDAKVKLVSDIDVLPSSFESEIRAKSSNGTNEQIAEAAELFVALRNASPQATSRFGDAEGVFLENVNTSVVLGVDVPTAVAEARKIQTLDPVVRKGRIQAHAQLQTTEGSDGEWLLGESDAFDIERGLFSPNTSAEVIDPGVQNAFSAEVQRMYAIDPDIEKARNRALVRMSKFWGATDVGGVERVQYLPPEKMYPDFGNDSEAITKQVVSNLREALIPEIEGVDDSDLAERILVNADEDSLREVDTRTGALSPGYNVFLRGEDDGPPVQLFHPDGSAVRFYPEVESMVEKIQRKNMAEAKTAHERKLEIFAAQGLRARGEERAKQFEEIIPGQVERRRRTSFAERAAARRRMATP